MSILTDIVASVRADLEMTRRRMPESVLREHACNAPAPPDFAAALGPAPAGRPRVIAELKRASPSKGLIRRDFGVVSLARELAENGAAALSVLTEVRYFRGGPEFLRAAAANVAIPVLRKDFIVEPYQLFEARAWGASAVLLIAAILPPPEYRRLHEQARELGLDVLTEVHTLRELRTVLDAGAEIVGINSRDLRTFEVDLARTEELLAEVPNGVVRVAESGIHDPEDLTRLQRAGADAFLIGETLMRAPRPGRELARLLRLPAGAGRVAGVLRPLASSLGVLL
ncbi:MAG: indole-3-glycerol phosphate synthase TrpC [Kiritimatiellaeota bacterium]|nr:indole-3-glycerol phosphate synthase TrpC [Kiritimatiellota bacterium]